MQKNIQWQCRWSPTLGNLEATHKDIWGTKDYSYKDTPTVFMGLYSHNDFYILWRHKGKKAILWCGSDIRHFINGYWLDNIGEIRMNPEPLARWIDENCESYVENKVEYDALRKIGIHSIICPSFLGDIKKFDISYKQSDRPKVYASVSGDDFELYRWSDIEKMAEENPDIDFYLYGNTKEWKTNQKNVIIRGRVNKEIMNREIKEMQGALRLLPFEGFSEVIAKSILMGQYPISIIPYPFMLLPSEIGELKNKQEPNHQGRDYYKTIINKYPWVIK